MDAEGYLKKHGWRGAGHALDKHGRGIKKPLLIAHKQDQLGLGQKKAAHRTDDQWWMRAFDESLKNIGTGQESTLSQVRKVGINRGGLYGFFVKGEGLVGTIDTEESESAKVSNSNTQPTTSTPHSSADVEMSDITNTPALKSTEPTDTKKRKRSEALDPAAKEAAVMKRIFRNVNIQVKKRLAADPSLNVKPETKASKLAFEKARREARSELKKQLVVDAMMAGDLSNPNNYTSKEKALENYEKDFGAQKKVDPDTGRSKEEGKSSKQGGTLVEKLERKKKQKLDNDAVATVITKTPEGHMVFQPIYPLPTSTQVRFATTDVSVDAAALQLELDQNAPAIKKKILKLSPDELVTYKQRAVLKQQSLELYVLRRIQKKAEKKTSKSASPDLFFVDVDGDTNLLEAPPSISTITPIYGPKADGSVPLDPSIWAGRSVKELTKAEKTARRDRTRSQHPPSAEKLAEQATLAKRKESEKQKKDALVKKILTEQGLAQGATKDQREAARSQAKKVIRAERDEKKETQPTKAGKSGAKKTGKGKGRKH